MKDETRSLSMANKYGNAILPEFDPLSDKPRVENSDVDMLPLIQHSNQKIPPLSPQKLGKLLLEYNMI